MANILLNVAHHSAGATAIAFSPDGKTLYTGGGDCVARVWTVSEGKDAETAAINDADEPLASITATENAWITASADSSVRLYNATSNQFQSLVLAGNAIPMRCVAVDPSHERIAICSDDLDVKVVDLKDTTKVLTLTGHKNGVRKATWHPSSSYLTTSGQDGRIIVWDMTGETPVVTKTLEGIIPFEDPDAAGFTNDCSAVWHPTGKHFYVATRTHEIISVSRDTWAKNGTFPTSDEISSEINALAISPNGMYLASASKDGILIWSTQIRRVLYRHQIDAQTSVNQLIFSPTQNLLCWGDTEGNLYRWVDPIPASQPGPATERVSKAATGRERTPGAELMEEDFGEDVDEDWIIDDLGGAAGGIINDSSKEKEKSYAREIVSVTKGQLPFQPGATPLKDKKGYLAYNSLGVVEVTDQDSHQIINVEFHDRSTYNSYHFTDYSRFTMASIGPRGIAYASAAGKSEPSKISYRPYATWGSSSEWSLSLPAGESVIAIAAGGIPTRRSYKARGADDADVEGAGNVVVATSIGYLRFFTGSGIQRYVWAMGGDIVSLVAGNEWVFVVHREGGTSLDGCQNLRYTLISLDRFEFVQEGQLPLPKPKTLKWIGVSDEGAPAMYDSRGVVFILDRFRRPGQGRWVPVLDTNTMARRIGKDETYWPVGVSVKMFMCLILKGRTEYPGFPRPLVQEFDLQIPLVPTEQEQVVSVEEKLLRETITLGWMRDALGSALSSDEIASRELEMDKEMIKLLQPAIKDRQLQRATDLIRLLNQVNSLDTASKLAEYYHLVGLQERIKALKEWREENEDPEEDRDQRRSWARGVQPIGAPGELVGHLLGGGHGGRPQEFKAPAFPKRSLASAIPNYGSNAFARKTDQSSPFARRTSGVASSSQVEESYSYSDLPEPESLEDNTQDKAYTPSPPPDGKRKRGIDDDDDEEMNTSTKKPRTSASGKASESAMPPPAQPFARKPAAVPANAKPNPFARGLAPAKSLIKSNTFFEKVDVAEASAPSKKGKTGEKKQATLFGMLPQEKGKTAKAKKANADDTDKGSATKPAIIADESQETQLVETPTEETQEETQAADETMEETQPAADDEEEPIDWPESPPREVLVS